MKFYYMMKWINLNLKQRLVSILISISILSILQSCSPFGKDSYISKSPLQDIIDPKISFNEEAVGSLVSSGMSKYETNPTTPSSNYTVYMTIGSPYEQNQVITNDGYKVNYNIQSGNE